MRGHSICCKKKLKKNTIAQLPSTTSFINSCGSGGGFVGPWCWVTFSTGTTGASILIWIIVGQGPTVLAVC